MGWIIKHPDGFIVNTRKRKNSAYFVWAMHNQEHYAARHIGQVWGAIQHYVHLLGGPIIIAGDFNSNKIWDRKKRTGNHSDVVRKLEEHNIYSSYHWFFNEEQGLESRPTFFLQRKQHKPCHINYCFASMIGAGEKYK